MSQGELRCQRWPQSNYYNLGTMLADVPKKLFNVESSKDIKDKIRNIIRIKLHNVVCVCVVSSLRYFTFLMEINF